MYADQAPHEDRRQHGPRYRQADPRLPGLARGDEVELRVEDERLIVGPVEVSARAARHRAKFAKAKARVHANVGPSSEAR